LRFSSELDDEDVQIRFHHFTYLGKLSARCGSTAPYGIETVTEIGTKRTELYALGLQFINFAGCGAIGTGAHYFMLLSGVYAAGMDAVHASSAGFLAGAAVNYGLNYRFTFKSSRSHRETLWKFVVVAAIGAAINAAIMASLIHGLALHYLLSQIFATAVVLVFNFGANRVWIFGV